MPPRRDDVLADRAPFNGAVFRRLLRYLAPYRRDFLLASLALLVGTVATQAGPYLTAIAIDRYIVPAARATSQGGALPPGVPGGIAALAALYLCASLVSWGAQYTQTYFMSWAGQNAIYALRAELYAHLQRLSFRFFDSQPAGVIMSRVTNDVNTIEEMLTQSVLTIVGSVVSLVTIVAAMVSLDARLALASFAVLPILAAVVFRFSERVRRAYGEVRNTIADVYANLQESISGMRVTQSFSREDRNLERFTGVNERNFRANMQAEGLNALFMPTVDLIGALGTALILWYGGRLEIARAVDIGVLVAFVQYMDRFYRPMRDMAQFYTQMQQAMAAAEKIFRVLDTPPEITDRPDARPLRRVRGRVEFEDVRFGYEEGKEVLHGISFVAEPGQRVALVGHTGAGKSSVINLLARFYDPWSGRILVDGVDIRDVPQRELRAHMGIVLQDNFLFSGTVAENIRYGRPGASDEEVVAAACAVGAHEFIERLPHGYATVVHERGASLSAGQRQLVAFARALLRDPRILILDEATSNIDAATEVIIQKALARLTEGRTSIVIAHRLSTVRDADLILVLEEGRIVEAGRHAELLARGGRYAEFHRAQIESVPRMAGG
ncbi:MAG: ABC transporter ATP-binding protein [Firmicutes bacterium]|nr:ABC transporter ATP-binding protein [Bacillota bacterium]